MATLSALVKVVAEIQGLDENQVLWIARYLREDGLIVSGGRGRGGAQMKAQDAANLLIGVNAPGSAKQAVEMVRRFRDFPVVLDQAAPEDPDEWDEIAVGAPFFDAFARGRPFGAALEALIGQFQNPKINYLSEVVRVEFSGPYLSAQIFIGERELERADDIAVSALFTPEKEPDRWGNERPDQQISKSFSHRTLASVGQVLLD